MPEYRDPVDRRRRYESLRGALGTGRSSFDAHWRELGDFLMPRRTRWWAGDRNKGDKRNQQIIDSDPRYAARTLASGLHAGLTSPARPWMKLSTPDPGLAEFGPVKEWLHDVTGKMLTVFATSNLYNVLPLVYLDLGVFGTASMAIVEDTKDLFRCYSYPTGSFSLGQDARGLATTFVRDYQQSVRQVVEAYGVQEDGRTIDWSHISQRIHDLWEDGEYEAAVNITWMVKPNELRDGERKTAKYKPWASCHFETDHTDGGIAKVFLRESGFDTFPVMAPRWDITGEDTYGTDCPGMMALGDIKQLQMQQREKAKLIKTVVAPPMTGPSSLRSQKVSVLPGDMTYVDVREGMQSLRPVYEPRLDGLQFLLEDMREVRYRVQRAFYEDLFLMLARSDDRLGADRPTAREIDERHEEKLIALGPVLERTNDELLGPLVDRVYAVMDAAGLIPEPPSEIVGVKLKVEYISILSQAQKLIGVAGQERLLQTVAGISQYQPEALDKLDTDQVIDNLADMLGTDPRLIRTTEAAEAIRADRRQAQAAQMQAEQAKLLAGAAKDASQAPLTGDSALARIVAGAGQAPGVAA